MSNNKRNENNVKFYSKISRVTIFFSILAFAYLTWVLYVGMLLHLSFHKSVSALIYYCCYMALYMWL